MMTEDFKIWESRRRFIAKVINKNGTILDIGCANGFFLKCLQKWTAYKLIPYGIDYNKKCIREAMNLFPLYADNFIFANVLELQNILKQSYLNKFDFVYWNIWDPWEFENQREIESLKLALKIVSAEGRLILGFYQSEKNKERKIEKLKKIIGLRPSGLIKSDSGDEVVVWFDKLNR